MSRKKSTGILMGKVHDMETGKGIPDIILKTEKSSAVTDKKGNFKFELNPGTHYLQIERSQIGLDKTTAMELPIAVKIEGGKDTKIDILIVKSSEVFGFMKVYKYKVEGSLSSKEEKDLVEDYCLTNVYLEITNGKEIRRTSTDNDGKFKFRDISPGKWTIILYNDFLPDYHYYEKEKVDIQVKPGENFEVNIRILPKVRKIKILDIDTTK
jgi:uncharacterized membrane protein